MTISNIANSYSRASEPAISRPLVDVATAAPIAMQKQSDAEQPANAKPEQVNPEQLKEWQHQLLTQRKLEFSIDEDSGRNVVKVIDSDSGDIIRQFPSEEVLKLSSLARAGKGGLFSGEA